MPNVAWPVGSSSPAAPASQSKRSHAGTAGADRHAALIARAGRGESQVEIAAERRLAIAATAATAAQPIALAPGAPLSRTQVSPAFKFSVYAGNARDTFVVHVSSCVRDEPHAGARVVLRAHRHGKIDELGADGRADAHAAVANLLARRERDAARRAERHGIAERRSADGGDAVAVRAR